MPDSIIDLHSVRVAEEIKEHRPLSPLDKPDLVYHTSTRQPLETRLSKATMRKSGISNRKRSNFLESGYGVGQKKKKRRLRCALE